MNNTIVDSLNISTIFARDDGISILKNKCMMELVNGKMFSYPMIRQIIQL